MNPQGMKINENICEATNDQQNISCEMAQSALATLPVGTLRTDIAYQQ